MATSSEKKRIFGASIEEYPEPCQSCAALAELVLLLEDPDLTEQPHYLPPGTARQRQIARMVFPLLKECSATACGLENANAVQPTTDL